MRRVKKILREKSLPNCTFLLDFDKKHELEFKNCKLSKKPFTLPQFDHLLKVEEDSREVW